jgi:hypothetical protein
LEGAVVLGANMQGTRQIAYSYRVKPRFYPDFLPPAPYNVNDPLQFDPDQLCVNIRECTSHTQEVTSCSLWPACGCIRALHNSVTVCTKSLPYSCLYMMIIMTHTQLHFRKRCYLRVRPFSKSRHCNTDWSITSQYFVASIVCWQVTSVSGENFHVPSPSYCHAWESGKAKRIGQGHEFHQTFNPCTSSLKSLFSQSIPVVRF